MSDMLSVGNERSDSGGASLQMKFLTEEEANAADAMEWNSKKAYGAREEDLVTFLEAIFQLILLLGTAQLGTNYLYGKAFLETIMKCTVSLLHL